MSTMMNGKYDFTYKIEIVIVNFIRTPYEYDIYSINDINSTNSV